ncbi:hypothetical protein Nepgr_015209 [Nepenthes gracilis]|uniref:Uncharacterized protein n=1 Tax=Nepenthes gracilis TaxID=150966 RepID=A0AAD3SKU1_NEPGR|nr:hypothetical protein Nepgr_015209 [Nepenthes gracilis]
MTGEIHGASFNQAYAHNDDLQDAEFSERGCCFWVPFLGSSSELGPDRCWERITAAEVDGEDSWWVRGWKKLREWSEILAGPRWKTFIRRFGKNVRAGRQGKFGYDPLSYAMNFDEGPGGNNDDWNEDNVFRGFSFRYAVIPASAKSSMDLGKDGPSFL